MMTDGRCEILNGKGLKEDIVSRLREFIENEARSCSVDFGCITPEYVYRMWDGTVPIEDIEDALTEIRKNGNSKIVNR